MKIALRQAKRGLGRTSPNPMVGAVIVRRGVVITTGYHKRAGARHAEVDALEKLGGKARAGDTLYVTLEPCNHFGKTPPCTEAILKSGIKRIVVGMKDPNPHVTGGGCETLMEKGLDVRTGILAPECRRLNEVFLKYVNRGLPYVVAKSAMTMDGWTATSTGHSQWITNEASRRFVHRLRDRVDGVMVGVGTVIADDPHLTTRIKGRKGKDPVRIIVDTHLSIPEHAKVLNSDSPSKTLIAVGKDVPSRRLKRIQNGGVSILVCPLRAGGIDLTALLEMLAERALTSLLLEGGSRLLGSMIRDKLIDKFYIFKAPKILGGNDGIPMAVGPGPEKMDACLRLRDVKVRRFGDDLMIRAYPAY